MTGSAAVFLDRDGVINRNVQDPSTGHYGAPLLPAQFALAPGAIDAMAALERRGFLLFLVSNQPNHAKGKSSMGDLLAIHQRLLDELDPAGVTLTESYYCFHHPDAVVPDYAGPCECRKPSPFFLLNAAPIFGIDLSQSWMIGDRATDVECGQRAGVRTIRVQEDHPAMRFDDEAAADFEVRDLAEAAEIILSSSVVRPKPNLSQQSA